MSRIVTFYSYKGGVGRTLALANIGVLLAKSGKRVLLMDWDLEAPGLDRYFQPFLSDGFSPGQGMIHLLQQAMNGEEANWKSHVTEVVVSSSEALSSERVALSVISSGVASPDYGETVRAFSWSNFVQEREGGPILEKWRNEWKKQYDFILVDSRTGITDTGGICTILLPDFLVLVFTANDQSFEGALGILNSIQRERRNLAVPRPPLMVLPLLSRFDRKVEVDESDKWLARFARDLKAIFDDWLPRQYSPLQMLELTKIPYVTRFSFGEPLPVLTHSLTDPELPGFYLENVARLIRTDFREAAQIIDPRAPLEQGVKAEVVAAIQRSPIDEMELRRLLRDAEQELGQSPEVADLLARAGNVLREHARFDSAEPLLRRALVIAERSYGTDHPDVAVCLINLAILLQATNRLAEAELLLRRALAIDEQSYGPDHPTVATNLNNLASLLYETNRLAEAEPLLRRALAIDEQSYGPDHPAVASDLNNLASLLQETNRLAEAEPLMRRALWIVLSFTHGTGHVHPRLRTAIKNYRHLLTVMSLDEKQIWQLLEVIGKEIGMEKERYRKILDQASDE